MDKEQLHQILSVLLMPYRDQKLICRDKDAVANLQYCFYNMKMRSSMSLDKYEKVEKEYYNKEKELMLFLLDHTEWGIKKLDDLKLLINIFFPEREAQEYIEVAKEYEDYGYAMDRLYIDNLYKIAISLLTYRDGRVAIRTWTNEDGDIFNYPNVFDKVQVWNLLGRMITVDIVIVAFMVGLGQYDLRNLNGQTSNIFLADKTLEKILEKGMAETHLHFNAGAEFTYLWQEKMNIYNLNAKLGNTNKELMNNGQIYIMLAAYRTFWAEYVESGKYKHGFSNYIQSQNSEIALIIKYWLKGIINGNLQKINIYDCLEILQYFMRRWNIADNVTGDFLSVTIYKNIPDYNTHAEMIFLLRSMTYFKTDYRNAEELHLFLQYIRYKNIYFNKDFVQNNQIEGLCNFSIIFGKMSKETNMLLTNKKVKYAIIFKSILQNTHLKKLEVRISPYVQIYADYERMDVRREIKQMYLKEIKTMLSAYEDYMQTIIGDENNFDDKIRKNCALPALGIIFHFRKTDFADNRIADTCWLQQAEDIDSKSKHIRVCRRALVEYAKILEELRYDIPLLSDYVVGIDVASQENKAEPWIFAPMYTAIRNRYITKPVLEDQYGNIQKINNIGFTYHVGEEYRHLLSGLRHIDEVIDHFHYKAGDRLGHAIALGTDVKEWTMRNEVVILPAMEYMEDMLWLWGKCVYDSWGENVNVGQLEGKIMRLAEKLYGDITGMTVLMLYEAYKDKFKLNYEENFKKMRKYRINDLRNKSAESFYDIEHFCKFYDSTQPYGIHWTSEKIFCTYFCPIYYQRFIEPQMVYVNEEDFKLLTNIQNMLIKKIEKIGIYVEVNPTSNVAIGDAKNFYSHHILNLNSKGLRENDEETHEVLLTVNSDDPIIFNTNCENELSYIYHALSYQGYNKERILNWIDKIRRMGMDSSFVKYEKEPSKQYKDIKELISNIDKALSNNNVKVIS